jgi:hypothetical protein
MSYIPIYSKLNELDERLKKVEGTHSLSTNVIETPPAVPSAQTVYDNTTELYNFKATVGTELFTIKTDIANITKELLNSSAIQLLSDTTTNEEIVPHAPKEELVPLATKEDLAVLATKEELVTLATKIAAKEELVTLATKEELVTLATKLATKEDLVTLATKEELVTLATKEELVPLATKEELVPLATKEELVPLATKEELVPLATKEELVPLKDLLEKFDNIINVIAQLNLKLNNVCEKVSLLESSSVTESS